MKLKFGKFGGGGGGGGGGRSGGCFPTWWWQCPWQLYALTEFILSEFHYEREAASMDACQVSTNHSRMRGT